MTSGANGTQDEARKVEDEAIEWLVRLRGPDAAAIKDQFEEWLAQSADHRHAHQWAMRHFDAAQILKQSERHGAGSRRNRPAARWLVAGGLVAAAASIALVLIGTHFVHRDAIRPATAPALVSTFSTRHGEIRTFRLPDGSLATLDTDTKLSVSMDTTARHLQLERGKARFLVNYDARPFLVTAGAGTVAAKAATFDVGYDEGQVQVRLISGTAEVRPVVQTAVYMVHSRQIPVGHNLCYRISDFRPEPIPARLRDVNDTRWTSGWVEYRAVPLAVLVDQANRYAATPIVIDRAAVGSLEASGRFRLTDTDAFVGRIAEVFDLGVIRRADGIHLSQK